MKIVQFLLLVFGLAISACCTTEATVSEATPKNPIPVPLLVSDLTGYAGVADLGGMQFYISQQVVFKDPYAKTYRTAGNAGEMVIVDTLNDITIQKLEQCQLKTINGSTLVFTFDSGTKEVSFVANAKNQYSLGAVGTWNVGAFAGFPKGYGVVYYGVDPRWVDISQSDAHIMVIKATQKVDETKVATGTTVNGKAPVYTPSGAPATPEKPKGPKKRTGHDF